MKSFYFKIFMKAPLFEKEGLGEIFLRYNFTHKVEFSSAKSPLSLFAKKGKFSFI